jgi:membrane protein
MATAAGSVGRTVDEPQRESPLRLAWRAFNTFRSHNMTDHAASLTYFAMMSLFPALLMAISLLGLFGQASIASDFANYVARKGADPATAQTVHNALAKLTEKSGGAVGVAFVVATLLALNGASGAYGAAGRALNVVHGVDEDRSFVRRKLTDVAATLVVLVLFLVVLVALFLGGGIADDLFGTIGLGDTAAAVWSIARWPVALLAALVAYALVYAFAPDVEPRTLRWISPGAATGVAIWIVGSVLFGVYIKNFSSYGAAYGAFGAAIVLLLWLYLTSNAFLFGAELNKAIERRTAAGRGGPPFVTPPPAGPAPDPEATSTGRPGPGT